MQLAEAKKRKFTAGEYRRIAEAGILREDERIELIKGEIIDMAAIGSHHAACVDKLNRLFTRNLSESVIVRVQNPVRIKEHSEPEPDVALLKLREDFYAEAHPMPEDVLLVVEVADTSLDYDRNVKLPVYAEAGIGEVWIVNLKDGYVEVWTKPSPKGYDALRRFHKGMRIVSECFSDMNICVDDIIGQWKYPLAV